MCTLAAFMLVRSLTSRVIISQLCQWEAERVLKDLKRDLSVKSSRPARGSGGQVARGANKGRAGSKDQGSRSHRGFG